MLLQVELAHGRRGSSSSYDLYSSYSSGGSRGGVSRRSDYRGESLLRVIGLLYAKDVIHVEFVGNTSNLCSFGHRAATFCFMAGLEGENSRFF